MEMLSGQHLAEAEQTSATKWLRLYVPWRTKYNVNGSLFTDHVVRTYKELRSRTTTRNWPAIKKTPSIKASTGEKGTTPSFATRPCWVLGRKFLISQRVYDRRTSRAWRNCRRTCSKFTERPSAALYKPTDVSPQSVVCCATWKSTIDYNRETDIYLTPMFGTSEPDACKAVNSWETVNNISNRVAV
jgi:hypothetical protein